jgi:hypothetical protein
MGRIEVDPFGPGMGPPGCMFDRAFARHQPVPRTICSLLFQSASAF